MSKTVRLWGAVALAVISWGESWVSIRAAVVHFTPGQLAFGRYLIASLVLLPLLLRNRPSFARRDWLTIFLSGFCGFTLYNLALNAGEQSISAGAAALIGSIIPVLVTLGAHLFLKQHVSKRALFGAGISFSGVALLALGGHDGIKLSTGALLVVAAAFCAAAYQLIQVRLRPRYGALDLTAAAIISGTFALLPFSGGLVHAVKVAPTSATLHMIVLGVFPGALGYVLWSWVLSHMSVARVMSFLFLVSPCAVLIGWAFLGELPSTFELCGGALALSGVIWCQTERK
ncbi:DMT family transporter [bacterium]|nr:MAG: DMT family transporter [bacterium]